MYDFVDGEGSMAPNGKHLHLQFSTKGSSVSAAASLLAPSFSPADWPAGVVEGCGQQSLVVSGLDERPCAVCSSMR